MQSNYESILGKYGRESSEIFRLLLTHGFIDFLGSDVHKIGSYPNIEYAIKKIKKIVGEENFLKLPEKNAEMVLENKKIEKGKLLEIKKICLEDISEL